MEHLKIEKAGPEQAPQLSALAKTVWEEHFIPLIGAGQVAYMLKKFQSEPAMRRQMEKDGYEYYFFLWDDKKVGYMGIQKETGSLFFSKLNITKEYRGRKISRAAMEFLAEICKREKLGKIRLTCNKHNDSSLAAYRALGFSVARAQVTDIGGGYAMDDYVLEKRTG